MNALIVKSPEISVRDDMVRVSCDLVLPNAVRNLWFACDRVHADKLSWDTTDAFVLAALVTAMREGLDIVIEGRLSARFHYNITNYYMEFLQCMVPGLRKVRIDARHLTREHWGAQGVYTGFSGGIDSFCTIFDHSKGRVSPEYEVTHLLFNNVGSHGQTVNDKAIFEERFVKLKKQAERLGLPVVKVDSNMDAVLGMDFQLTHTPRNISAALLFQRSCGKFLYSSTVHYRDAHVGGTYDIGHADAIGVALLSTETTECISAGGQRTRFEKTEAISAFEETYLGLDVCVAPGDATKTNCSKCWKCLRTELTLDVIGALSRYDGVFEPETYRRLRWLYICEILNSAAPLEREIVEGFKKYGYEVPVSARLLARIIPGTLMARALDIARRRRLPRRNAAGRVERPPAHDGSGEGRSLSGLV